jgi:hypothetical protein
MTTGIAVLLGIVVVAVFMVSSVIVNAYAQGRQTFPRVHEEEYIEVRPWEKYNCPDCKMIFQGTEFTVWEHTDGNRVVVAVPITNNATFLDESFIYNYCFTGVIHTIPGACDDPEYEQYRIK